MKKYLIIIEKKSLQRTIEGIYNKNKEKLDYEADFMHLNSAVSHISDKHFEIDLNDDNWTNLKLNSINVPEGYYIIDSDYSKEQLCKIKALIDINEYDNVINAFDADLYGQLLYEKTKELLDITIQDKRMVSKDLTDANILKALQSFESNDDFRKNILKELIV